MGLFVRKVRTASGATAVQIAHTKRGVQTIVEHIGSAHDGAALAALVQVAKDKIQGGQGSFDLDALSPGGGAAPARSVSGAPVIVASRAQVLWDVLSEAYERIGFAAVGDEAFRQLVLARLVEPTSKADTLRVLDELGVTGAPSLRTIWRTLAKCAKEDWRDAACRAAYAHATAGRALALVMYDLTVRREALVVRAEVRDLCLIPCRSGGFEAGGSLIGETSGRAGAAPTKSCCVSTVGWRGRGEHAEEVYARNRCHHLS